MPHDIQDDDTIAKEGGGKGAASEKDPHLVPLDANRLANTPPSPVGAVDRFAISKPWSAVRFRGVHNVRAYDAEKEQLLVDERRQQHQQQHQHQHQQQQQSPLPPQTTTTTTTTTTTIPLCGDDGGDDDDADPTAHHEAAAMAPTATVGTAKRIFAAAPMALPKILRLAYALVAILSGAYFFVLCLQTCVFVFVNLPVTESSSHKNDASDGAFGGGGISSHATTVGLLLCIPMLSYGMASIMAMCSSFVADAFKGGTLLKAVLGIKHVMLAETIYFGICLCVPAMTLVVTFLAQFTNPWRVMCQVWALGVCLLFAVFSLALVYREVAASAQLLALHHDDASETNNQMATEDARSPWERRLAVLRHSVLLVQTQRYAGHQDARLVGSSRDEPSRQDCSLDGHVSPLQTSRSLYTRLTQSSWLHANKVFQQLQPPVRLHAMELSGSLEAAYCRNHPSRHAVVVAGSDVHHACQAVAVGVTNVAIAALTTLFIGTLLVWVKAGILFYVVVPMACLLCCTLSLAPESRQLYNYLYSDNEQAPDADPEEGDEKEENAYLMGAAKDTIEKDETLVHSQLLETLRVTQPTHRLCFLLATLELGVFYLWPCASFFVTKTKRVGCIFMVLGSFSLLRRLFNPAVILAELGNPTDISVEKEDQATSCLVTTSGQRSGFLTGSSVARRKLMAKSRLSEIVGSTTRSQAVGRWMLLFAVLLLRCFISLVWIAASVDGVAPVDRSVRPPIVLLDDFFYPGEHNSLQRPTCELSQKFQLPFASGESSNSMLGDYSMMSALAYERPSVTAYILSQWFGPGNAIDEHEFVSSWRIRSGTNPIPVFFKFFTFPDFPDLGVVAIRGTETDSDWWVNVHLWCASYLSQCVKWVVPFGWIWDPILDDMVYMLSWVEDEKRRSAHHYTVPASFVSAISKGGFGGRASYGTARVTGVSMGGGLAAIAGAQSEVPTMAISGPGPELARHAWYPPVSMEQINENVFDFIPDRDYIARVGGRPRNNQEIACSAHPMDLLGCHSMWRSLCEIQYQCGSSGRPTVCRCVQEFGYPEPIQTGTRSFQDACSAEKEAFRTATDDNGA